MVWLKFLGLAGIIGMAGYHLSYHGDQIAEKTGLGQNLIGIILFATITSLPELMTGLSSIVITDNPNLAMGDVLGSCIFNLALVFILDMIYRDGSIFSKATQGHVVTGGLGIILISFVGFSMTLTRNLELPQIGHVGWYSFIIPVLYLLCIKISYNFEKGSQALPEKGDSPVPLKKNIIIFSIAAIVIIISASALPFVGERIMHVMGWKSSFVGTVFMAFATSLPEIAVTISAIRLKAVDIAFSNLLGSNLFNILVLALDDFAFTKDSLFKVADPGHLMTVFTALMMTGIVTLALIIPPKKRFLKTVSYISLVILGLFLINVYVIFRSGT